MSVSTLGTGLSPAPSVGLPVGLRKVYYGKMADLTWMLFGAVNGVGRGMGV